MARNFCWFFLERGGFRFIANPLQISYFPSLIITYRFSFFLPCRCNLLEVPDDGGEVPLSRGRVDLSFRPFEITTLLFFFE